MDNEMNPYINQKFNQVFDHSLNNYEQMGSIKSDNNKKIRPSPKTSATLYKKGTKKTGNDGNIWKVVENINGVKRWKIDRKKTETKNKTKSKTDKKTKKQKISVLDLYDVVHIDETEFKNICKKSNYQIQETINSINKLIIDLRKIGKISHIIPLPLSSGKIWWSDYADDYLNDIYGSEWFDDPNGYMYFTVYMNQSGTEINEKEMISVSYSNMSLNDKIKIIKLLDTHLQNQYVWTGRNTDKIFVQFVRSKTQKIDTASLKEEDVYPSLSINIKYYENINLIRTTSFVPELSNEFEKLLNIDSKKTSVYYNYGIHDVSIEYNSFPLKTYNKNISKIIKYLDIETKGERIKKYNVRMMLGADDVHEVLSSKK